MPVVRGVGVLGQALVLGIQGAAFLGRGSPDGRKRQKQDPKPVRRTKEPAQASSWLIAGNLVLALGINILLFIVLPLFMTRLLQTQIGFRSSSPIQRHRRTVPRPRICDVPLLCVSWMKDMNRVFQYHGAEHKTVYNFEAPKTLKCRQRAEVLDAASAVRNEFPVRGHDRQHSGFLDRSLRYVHGKTAFAHRAASARRGHFLRDHPLFGKTSRRACCEWSPFPDCCFRKSRPNHRTTLKSRSPFARWKKLLTV